jgi:ferrochelatase
MRYGEPSIASAMGRLVDAGAERIVVFPLYPQYSSSSTGSTLEEVFRVAERSWNVPYIQVVPPFYDAPEFLSASALTIRPTLDRVRPEAVFFSFHGLPERHVRKSDSTGAHCLASPNCCERIVEANRHCYRAQCVATAKRLGDLLAIPADQRLICFQSRLGRDPWLRPYTDELIVTAARGGMRRAVIVSPAFVADCLETLEELGLRAAESWRASGGDILELAPSLNASPAWADAVVAIAQRHAPWLASAPAAPSDSQR